MNTIETIKLDVSRDVLINDMSLMMADDDGNPSDADDSGEDDYHCGNQVDQKKMKDKYVADKAFEIDEHKKRWTPIVELCCIFYTMKSFH